MDIIKPQTKDTAAKKCRVSLLPCVQKQKGESPPQPLKAHTSCHSDKLSYYSAYFIGTPTIYILNFHHIIK